MFGCLAKKKILSEGKRDLNSKNIFVLESEIMNYLIKNYEYEGCTLTK